MWVLWKSGLLFSVSVLLLAWKFWTWSVCVYLCVFVLQCGCVIYAVVLFICPNTFVSRLICLSVCLSNIHCVWCSQHENRTFLREMRLDRWVLHYHVFFYTVYHNTLLVFPHCICCFIVKKLWNNKLWHCSISI